MSVARVLQYETTAEGVRHNNGFTTIVTAPIGIDVSQLMQKRYVILQSCGRSDGSWHLFSRDPEVAENTALLLERYRDLKVVVARDKLDRVKGVRQVRPDPLFGLDYRNRCTTEIAE